MIKVEFLFTKNWHKTDEFLSSCVILRLYEKNSKLLRKKGSIYRCSRIYTNLVKNLNYK